MKKKPSRMHFRESVSSSSCSKIDVDFVMIYRWNQNVIWSLTRNSSKGNCHIFTKLINRYRLLYNCKTVLIVVNQFLCCFCIRSHYVPTRITKKIQFLLGCKLSLTHTLTRVCVCLFKVRHLAPW